MGGREGGGGSEGGQFDMNGDEVFQCQFDLYLVGETSFHRNSEIEIKYYALVGGILMECADYDQLGSSLT